MEKRRSEVLNSGVPLGHGMSKNNKKNLRYFEIICQDAVDRLIALKTVAPSLESTLFQSSVDLDDPVALKELCEDLAKHDKSDFPDRTTADSVDSQAEAKDNVQQSSDHKRTPKRRGHGKANDMVAGYIAKQKGRLDIAPREIIQATGLSPSTVSSTAAWKNQRKAQKARAAANEKALRGNARLTNFDKS